MGRPYLQVNDPELINTTTGHLAYLASSSMTQHFWGLHCCIVMTVKAV